MRPVTQGQGLSKRDFQRILDGARLVTLVATLGHHRRFATDWSKLRTSTRELLEFGEQRAMSAAEYGDVQLQRTELSAAWVDWLGEHRIDAVIEPTVPMVAPKRGHGYDEFFTAEAGAYIAFTHYWNWTGFPVAALPAGLDP